jgi:hypothetical protein
LKSTWFSVLLSNPLTKDEFIRLNRTLVYVVVSLRNGRSEPGAEFSSKQRFSPLACAGDAGYLFAIAITIAVLLCRVSLAILN